MLTPKQEVFCQNIIAGLSGKRAYLAAYNSKSENAAQVESVKLLQREDIRERLIELRKPIETLCISQNLSNRDKQIQFINERIEESIKNGDENAVIRYTDMLNRIYNLYKEDHETTAHDNDLNNIDTTLLQRLTNAV